MEKSHGIPKWKYWLSYLKEVHIESAPSDINPHLYVSLDRGRMQLCTENAVYSYEDRYDNFRLLFDQIDLPSQPFKKALLLGLGLGSVPLLIELSGLVLDEMSLVEIDENVIYLAEKYGLSRLSFPYTVYCTDAEIFVNVHQSKYDLILSDVFLDDTIPNYFMSSEYLERLSSLLNPEGLLIVNTLASTANDKKISSKYFEQVFSKVFSDGYKKHVWENYMMMNRHVEVT